MADYARMVADAGARIIGGCCGTTPTHIAAMREALDGYQTGDKPEVTTLEQTLGAISTGAKAQLNGDLSVAGGSASGGRERRSRRTTRRA